MAAEKIELSGMSSKNGLYFSILLIAGSMSFGVSDETPLVFGPVSSQGDFDLSYVTQPDHYYILVELDHRLEDRIVKYVVITYLGLFETQGCDEARGGG